MKKLYFLDEEEKNRILNIHESATKRQYLNEQALDLGQPTQPEVGPQTLENTSGTIIKKGLAGDSYVYAKLGNDFYYAKSSDGDSPNWVLATNPKAINAIKGKIYNEKIPTVKNIKSPVKNTAKVQSQKNTQKTQSGQNFDFNDPLKLKQLNQKNAFNTGDAPTKISNKGIVMKIKTKNPAIKPGVSSWLRKRFPNIAELLKGRPLTPDDLTTDQKKALLQVIQNSQKSNPKQKNSGNTTYSDYGPEVYSEFVNNHGSPTMWDTIWETVTNNDLFAMATLFGRFNWVKNSDGSYTINDKYDFAPPGYENVTGVNRKTLEGKSIAELSAQYGLNPYEAARVKGWVDHPDNIPSKSIPLKININPSQLA
jgi:hypothetical protein